MVTDPDAKREAHEANLRRDALRRILDEERITVADLARRAGLSSPNTIYNFLNGHSASLSSRTLDAFLQALPHRSYSDFAGHLSEDPREALDLSRIAPVYVRGAVERGRFRDSPDYPPQLQRTVALPYENELPPGIYALEIKDDESIYERGALLFCAPLAQYNRRISPGRSVIVHRYRGGKVETLVGILDLIDGKQVIAEINDEPVPVPDGYTGGLVPWGDDRMEITAVVVAVHIHEDI